MYIFLLNIRENIAKQSKKIIFKTSYITMQKFLRFEIKINFMALCHSVIPAFQTFPRRRFLVLRRERLGDDKNTENGQFHRVGDHKNDDTFSTCVPFPFSSEVIRAKSSNEISANLLPADIRVTQ